MKRVFVGHRGVGKTSLLKRHETYFPNVAHFDLDHEVEKIAKMSVSDYFKNNGEAAFRKLEIKTYEMLRAENRAYVISLGAGFSPGLINQDDEVIFVTRSTDADGRIFLNRPRLNPESSALEESRKRYLERQAGFSDRANQIYFMPEGIEKENTIEKSVLTNWFQISGAYYTIAQSEIVNIESIQEKYSQIELRTDLIKLKTIEELTKAYPTFKWLVSVRDNHQINLNPAIQIDWDVNLKKLSIAPSIYSSHDDEITVGIEKLKSYKGHLKLCPVVENFVDLRLGYAWQQQDSENRSFLPRSSSGKWIWYRKLAKYFQKINFIRNFSFISDQPSAYEWLTLPSVKPKKWAAVLGKPVYFSRTLLQHENYFSAQQTFVTRIDISAEELIANIEWLQKLGLTFAAVTSPLKKTAYQLSADLSTEAKQLKSVNTLMMQPNKISGHNTDLAGFQFLVKDLSIDQSQIAVWGGGGTLEMLKSVLPDANYFSSQTGQLRNMMTEAPNIKLLIWAAPRTTATLFPNENLQIAQVIDLNYVENSMGLEYAAEKNIKYVSGLEMFKQQALKQQEYWSTK
ncbi:MAG: hypothetical protein H7328_12595 [Bdellovibrio sp.]|nr:hypothetical protein [Bdellovibrio sp.]